MDDQRRYLEQLDQRSQRRMRISYTLTAINLGTLIFWIGNMIGRMS
jgi:hypothetical protein